MNHRRLQRTLFRMQMDPGFAAAIFRGDRDAVGSAQLGQPELGVLLAADPVAIAADHGNLRRVQVVSNATSELTMTIALACRGPRGGRFVMDFLSSAHFHRAIIEDQRLPFAFMDYASECISDPFVRDLLLLEGEMARARREDRLVSPLRHGEVRLAPHARIVQVQAGLMAYAGLLKQAVASGSDVPQPPTHTTGGEIILITPLGAPDPFRLRQVQVEVLSALVGAWLQRAVAPVDAMARAAFAAAWEVSEEDLDGFIADLVQEGLMLRG